MSTSYGIPFCRAEYWISGRQMLGLAQSQLTTVGKQKIIQGKKKDLQFFLHFSPSELAEKDSVFEVSSF